MTKYHRTVPSQATQNKPFGRHIFLWLLFLSVAATILQWIPQAVMGPILALLLLFTYFALKETVLATVIIVFINDGLGTIIGNGMRVNGSLSLSFSYLLLIFIFYEIFFHKNLTLRSLLLFGLSLVICGQLSISSDIPWRQVFFAVLYTTALIVQYFKYSDQPAEFFDKLCTALAVTFSLISVHALITGGVEYYELNEYSEEFVRKGIIGAGNGDSNFSGLFLCLGTIGVLNSTALHRIQKIILFCLIISALSLTLSVTAVLILSIIVLLNSTIGKTVPKAVIVLLVIILLVVVLYNVYISLPASQRNETIDAYVERISSKLDSFFDNDLNTATTNRTHIWERYRYYILRVQGIIKLLFGGNNIFVLGGAPHNTYIDWILQFGIIGALLLIILIFRRLVGVYQLPSDVSYRKFLITVKALFLLYALTISIYNGSTFAALFFFVFVL